MQVERIQINNLRSISSCELTDCGGFNVLIGKNNSGKSNILSAINAFFLAVNDEAVIHLASPISKDVDFYNNNTEIPAEVILTFLMNESERSALIADIIKDYPQVANAVNGLDPESRLRVRVCFTLEPTAFAYVGRISLVPRDSVDLSTSDSENIILDTSPEAARQLLHNYQHYQSQQARTNELQALFQNTDREDWQHMKARSSEDALPFRRPVPPGRRPSFNHESQVLMDSMVAQSESFDEFRNALQVEINGSARYAESFERHNLEQQFVETFSGRSSVIPSHVLNVLRGLSEVKVLNVTVERRPIGEDEARRLLNLKTQRGGQEPLDRIQGVVSTLLGVKIDAFSGQQILRRGMPVAELDVDNFVVEVNGSGIKEALRLLLDIEFEDPNLLLVEEPEMHLHPGLETAMMRHLEQVSQHRQVFITTHSTNFLDTANTQKIFLVTKAESTTTKLLERAEIEEEVPSELGIRLSSLFIYDRLVFVEGPSDEEIIRAWAFTLGVNLDQSNVGFIHIGGSRNLSYFATGTALSFLSRRGVKMWFLIDRDEKDEEDIRKIKDAFGDGVDSSVLDKREIENYLLHPRILAEHIEERLRQANARLDPQVTAEDIFVQVDNAAEDLKTVTIVKRIAKNLCYPLYPEKSQWWEGVRDNDVKDRISEQLEIWESRLIDSRNQVARVAEQQTAEVEAQWKDRKLDLVEGELVLDSLFSNYDLRFQKRGRDGVQLAKRMSKEEIGSEIERLIRNIAS